MKIFPKKEKPDKKQPDKEQTSTDKSSVQNFTAQLLSPATALAILGTAALIFSFYRGGQLATLVIPKDQMNQAKENGTAFKDRPKVDINSQAVIDIANTSEGAAFAVSGNYKQAVSQALKDLTNNPPDYLPTIVEAGDILSQFGDDKELGLGLLERAVTLAPNNQYLALHYCQKLVVSERAAEAEPKLLQLIKKYPQWPDPRIVLGKIHFVQNKLPIATTEFVELSTNRNLNSKEREQVALMLAKLGRTTDGFIVFQKAASCEPKESFYTYYCQDWVSKNPGSYDTVLAMVKTNLAENKNSPNISKQLALEIKHAALLLLLGRAQDAQTSLDPIIAANPKNFDLHILQAAAYAILGQNDKAKASFQKAATCYRPNSNS